MQISSDSKFIIYGAGARGRKYYEMISQNNMQVLAFVDRNASKIQSINNTPIYEMKDLEQVTFDKQTVIVVISISNVFQHYDIAKQLFDAGYKYIVYKELFDNTLYGKNINRIFQAISLLRNREKLGGLELPAFRVAQVMDVTESGGEYITKSVPIELLFGLSKELYISAAEKKDRKLIDLIPDKSLLYFTINKDLARFFLDEINEKEWRKYIALYFEQRRCMVTENTVDMDDERHHLTDRYLIFQNMEILYNTNIDFFYENPIDVEWNPKGYFNMQDGNNRAAFLFTKGMNMLPCMMKYDDFETWLNKAKIKEVEDCINKIGTIEYPISNPYFASLFSKANPFCYLKLRKICNWLYNMSIRISETSVLDIGCKNGFMGQHFARMGAKVTAVENDDLYRDMCKKVNELLFLDEEVLDEYCYLKDREFDIILIPLWASESLPEILESVSGRILIIDATDPQMVYSDSVWTSNYDGMELCRLFYDCQIVHTIIYTKNEIGGPKNVVWR